MKRQRLGIALAAVLLAFPGAPAAAQQPAKAPAQQPAKAAAQPPAVAPAPDIDPDAVAALDRMGAYLRTVKTFRVKAVTTRDRVLENGQLVQADSKVDILARFPDRLRLDTESTRQERMYLYDGKSFTIYGKRIQYYATIPAPPTIGQLSLMLSDKYDISIPLEDLFWWGTEKVNSSVITSATEIGPADVLGTTCQQYAFRQEGLDWQIWIQLGENPLPRKLVITTTTDASRPQYSAVYMWDLAPSYNEAAFVFDPPAGALKIPLATANGDKAGN